MSISINRIGDKFVIRFDVIGLDGCTLTNTLEVGWQEADEMQRIINQHLLDWQFEKDPHSLIDGEVQPF